MNIVLSCSYHSSLMVFTYSSGTIYVPGPGTNSKSPGRLSWRFQDNWSLWFWFQIAEQLLHLHVVVSHTLANVHPDVNPDVHPSIKPWFLSFGFCNIIIATTAYCPLTQNHAFVDTWNRQCSNIMNILQ